MSVSRGKPINITDYRESFPTAWRHDGETVYSNHIDGGFDRADWSTTFYISAPCFVLEFRGGNSFDASSTTHYYLSKWDGQNGFNDYYDNSFNASHGSWGSWDYVTHRFIHNKDNESANKKDNSDIHLWKVRVTFASGGLGGKDLRIRIWAGGIEVVPQTSQYDYMWKKGSLLYASTGNYYTTSDYGSDIAFINAQKPGAFRGTLISAGTANYAYSVRE